MEKKHGSFPTGRFAIGSHFDGKPRKETKANENFPSAEDDGGMKLPCEKNVGFGFGFGGTGGFGVCTANTVGPNTKEDNTDEKDENVQFGNDRFEERDEEPNFPYEENVGFGFGGTGGFGASTNAENLKTEENDNAGFNRGGRIGACETGSNFNYEKDEKAEFGDGCFEERDEGGNFPCEENVGFDFGGFGASIKDGANFKNEGNDEGANFPYEEKVGFVFGGAGGFRASAKDGENFKSKGNDDAGFNRGGRVAGRENGRNFTECNGNDDVEKRNEEENTSVEEHLYTDADITQKRGSEFETTVRVKQSGLGTGFHGTGDSGKPVAKEVNSGFDGIGCGQSDEGKNLPDEADQDANSVHTSDVGQKSMAPLYLSPIPSNGYGGDSAFVTGCATPTKQWDIKCDDCNCNEPIRVWRWCRVCDRVLCETCSVEGHFQHVIESYATAVRRLNTEHYKVQDENDRIFQKFRHQAAVIKETADDVAAKLAAVQCQVWAKLDESGDMEGTLRDHFATMVVLKGQQLNAKTWREREQAVSGMRELMEIASNTQKSAEEYLKVIDTMVDANGLKLNKIFREF